MFDGEVVWDMCFSDDDSYLRKPFRSESAVFLFLSTRYVVAWLTSISTSTRLFREPEEPRALGKIVSSNSNLPLVLYIFGIIRTLQFLICFFLNS